LNAPGIQLGQGADGRHVVRIVINPDQPEERAEFEVREDRILLDAA
jgi:hypothetical protein